MNTKVYLVAVESETEGIILDDSEVFSRFEGAMDFMSQLEKKYSNTECNVFIKTMILIS